MINQRHYKDERPSRQLSTDEYEAIYSDLITQNSARFKQELHSFVGQYIENRNYIARSFRLPADSTYYKQLYTEVYHIAMNGIKEYFGVRDDGK